MHIHGEKKAVLTRQLNGIVYELLVKTHSDMVYVGKKVTLTEKLKEFADLITSDRQIVENIQEKFEALYHDAPEQFQSFKEIWDYVNIEGNPKSALAELIDTKVEKVEGKGLSECDFTQVLRALVVNDYTPEQIDNKFSFVIERIERAEAKLDDMEVAVEQLERAHNIYIGEMTPENVKDGDIWYQLIETE